MRLLSESKLKKKQYDAQRYCDMSEDQKEKIREKSRRWREKNIEKARGYARRWRENNPGHKEKARITKKSWMSIPENRVKNSLYQAKRRAKEAGIEFNITVDDLKPLPTICSVLGLKINYYGNSGFINDSPSIDRIDSSKGYVKGNVKIICWRANRLKVMRP